MTATVVLSATLFGVASAAPAFRFPVRHFAGGVCEGRGDGGYLTAAFASDSLHGLHVTISAWLDPADPATDPPTAFADGTDLTVIEGQGEVTFNATVPVVGPDGTSLGDGTLSATLAYSGDRIVSPPQPGNGDPRFISRSVDQPLAGTGTFEWNGGSLTVTCTGDLLDVYMIQTNPGPRS